MLKANTVLKGLALEVTHINLPPTPLAITIHIVQAQTPGDGGDGKCILHLDIH